MLAEELARYTHDPLNAVRYGFPWGEGDLEPFSGPRKWQTEVLDFVGRWFSNRLQGDDLTRFGSATRYKPCRIAVSSGNGPGKSTLAALLGWASISTFEDCRINVTANTKAQLDTKTSPEFTKWFRIALNADWFLVNVTSIKVKEENHEKNWRIDFLPWSDANPAATAGQHNARKRLVLIFDEASEIADVIFETAEGALTDEYTEIIWLLLGNPTRPTGAFYDAVFGRAKHRWKSWVLDSRNIEGTNQAQIAEWLADYGEDSDWFRIHVRGLSPRSGSGQFIDAERISAAQKRAVRTLDDDSLVAGVDFAWGGDDDNVIRFRRGLDARTIPAIKVHGEFTRDPAVMTGKLIDVLNSYYACNDGQRRKVDMLFFDSAGIAAPIEARLRALGYGDRIMVVNFGADSPKSHCAYFRDYMWEEMKQWLLQGAIDADAQLESDLSKPLLVTDPKNRIKLESKDKMKARLKTLGQDGASPDDADALALTFAYPVLPKKQHTETPAPAPRNDSLGWMG